MNTIITDPGVDDLVALTLLNKLDPNPSNLIVSFGNVNLELTTKNAKEFINFIAPHWTYFKGSDMPLRGELNADWAVFFHGEDGSWGVHPKIDNKEIDELEEFPKNEEVISLGPLTDLVKLQEVTRLKKVMVMGGAFFVPGNETKFAEFNIAADPDAASLFFKNLKQTQVRVVSLDGAGTTTWPLSLVKEIPETTSINIWLKELLLAWFNNFHDPKAEFKLYDPLAIYLHFFPEDAKWVRGDVEVILDGEKRGKTILKENSSGNVEVAVEIINPKTVQQKIFDLIFN